MSSWPWTWKLPPTGSCWRARRAGRCGGSLTTLGAPSLECRIWDLGPQGQGLVLTFHVSSGYRLESGMQNMSIHTKTTSGYAGECPRLGGQGRRAASTGPSGAAEEAGAQQGHKPACFCALSLSCVRVFVTLRSVAHQAALSMGFSRQEYWSGLLCPPTGDFPDPGL